MQWRDASLARLMSFAARHAEVEYRSADNNTWENSTAQLDASSLRGEGGWVRLTRKAGLRAALGAVGNLTERATYLTDGTGRDVMRCASQSQRALTCMRPPVA